MSQRQHTLGFSCKSVRNTSPTIELQSVKSENRINITTSKNTERNINTTLSQHLASRNCEYTHEDVVNISHCPDETQIN